MARMLGSLMKGGAPDAFTSVDPVTVGDGIFQILCSLNRKASDLRLILKPLHDYLSCMHMGESEETECDITHSSLTQIYIAYALLLSQIIARRTAIELFQRSLLVSKLNTLRDDRVRVSLKFYLV